MEHPEYKDLLMVNLLASTYWFDEALQAGIRAKGWTSLSRTQSMIFTNMAAGVFRTAQLARNMGLSRQAVAQAVAELKERGLVEITPDPQDGRALVVNFTETSEALNRDAIAIFDVIETELAARIGKTAVKALRKAAAMDWGVPPVAEVEAACGVVPTPPKRRGRPPLKSK